MFCCLLDRICKSTLHAECFYICGSTRKSRNCGYFPRTQCLKIDSHSRTASRIFSPRKSKIYAPRLRILTAAKQFAACGPVITKTSCMHEVFVIAGPQGFEPWSTVLETAILPLNYRPVCAKGYFAEATIAYFEEICIMCARGRNRTYINPLGRDCSIH